MVNISYLESVDLILKSIAILDGYLLAGDLPLHPLQPLVQLVQVLIGLAELLLDGLLRTEMISFK